MSTGFVGVGVEIPRNRVGSVRNGCPRSVCDRRVGVVMFAKRVRRQGGKGDKRTDAEGRGTPSEGKEGLGEEGMFEVDGIIEKGDKEDIVEEFEFQGPLAPKSYAKSDEGAMASAARRRRKKRNLKKSGKKDEVSVEVSSGVDSNVRELTKSFALDKKKLQENMEMDPDYIIIQKEASEDYDLTASLLGRGRKNKDLGYVLPYLQNSHLIGLLVILLCAYVYYPGFPLTELSDDTRNILQKGLLVTFTVNSVLCIQAYIDAKERGQPWGLWVLKVFLLGGLALNELQVNIPPLAKKE